MADDFVFDSQPYEAPESEATPSYEAISPSFGSAYFSTARSSIENLIGRETQTEEAQEQGVPDEQAREANKLEWPPRKRNTFLPPTDSGATGIPDLDISTSPMMDPDQYNKQYAPPGQSLGDKPMPESVARVMGQQLADKIKADDTLAHYSDGHPWYGLGAAALRGVMDPINAATMVLPGVGEEAMLEGAGRIGLTGFLGRTAARVGAGAASGAIAQAPLSAIQYGLAQTPYSVDEYGIRNVFQDMMFSAAGGALLHAAGGAIGDTVRGDLLRKEAETPILTADAETKSTAMNSAVAQLLDGRPVDVTPVFNMAAATRARNELTSWYAQSARLAAEADQALRAADTGAGNAADLTAKLQTVTDQLERLRSEHAGFVSDMQGAQDRLGQAVDTQTPQRIAAIDSELAQTGLPAPRRDELTAERTMLTEGVAQPPAAEALEQARTQAEIEGLQTGMQRVAGQIASLEKRAGPLQEKATTTAKQTDVALKIRSDRIASREKIVNAMTARSIRRYAGRIGARFDPGEDAAFASRIMSNGKEEIPKILDELRGRAAPLSNDLIPRTEPDDNDTAALRDNINAPVQTWAPETQARDADGQLVTVYHGTPFDFDHFDNSKLGTATGDANTQYGFFFSADKGVADRYGAAEQTPLEKALQTLTFGGYKRLKDAVKKLFGSARGRTLTANLDVRNPKTVDLPGGDYYSEVQVEEALRKAKAEGYDSVKFRSLDDNGAPRPQGDMWVVFDPKQIKIVDHGDPSLNAKMAAEHPAPDAQLLAEAHTKFSQTSRSIFDKTVLDQQALRRDGYAPGISQDELNRLEGEIYHPEPLEAEVSPKAPEPTSKVSPEKEGAAKGDEGDENPLPKTELDSALMRAEADLAMTGRPLLPADQAEIAAADQAIERAGFLQQAFQQAAVCLRGAGI